MVRIGDALDLVRQTSKIKLAQQKERNESRSRLVGPVVDGVKLQDGDVRFNLRWSWLANEGGTHYDETKVYVPVVIGLNLYILSDLCKELSQEFGSKSKQTKLNAQEIEVKCLSDYKDFVRALSSEKCMATHENQLFTSGLGLAGEAGECADIVKKVTFHGHNFDRTKYIKELGDVLWYVAFSANMLGIEIEEIILENVRKLKERYKEGTFKVADSHNRNQ